MRKSCRYDDHYYNGKDTCQCGKYKKEPKVEHPVSSDGYYELLQNISDLLSDRGKGIKD